MINRLCIGFLNFLWKFLSLSYPNTVTLKRNKEKGLICVSNHSLPFSRIEMSKDALPEKACQLDSRYWRITNAKGDVEEVQGPGVVGM